MKILSEFIVENLIFCCIFICVLIIYLVFEIFQIRKSKYTLSVFDSVIIINNNGGIYIDTRDINSFSNEHIIGAHNIQFDKIMINHNIISKYKNKPIVIYGNNSKKVMKYLNSKGFNYVFLLKGGLDSWLQAHYPVKSLLK